MTPLTITVSPWNYCQNNCHYCVSKSNTPRWKWNGSFELFSPPGDEQLNDVQLRQKHGFHYYDMMCEDKARYMNKWEVLEFPYLVHWLKTHTPGAEIHLAGGEPLLRPDIETGVESLVNAGFNVTLVTNGILIPKRRRLHQLPIKWLVNHHAAQTTPKFLESIESIRNQKHLITRIIVGNHVLRNRGRLEKAYKGFNFMWRGCNAPARGIDFKPLPVDVGRIASQVLHFIHHDGRVFPCNSLSFGEIGHVYLGTYEPEKAAAADRHSIKCVNANHCGAYHSAVLMNAL